MRVRSVSQLRRSPPSLPPTKDPAGNRSALPHDLQQGRVDDRRPGQDVAAQVSRPSLPIAHEAACLLDEQRPGGHVPRPQAELEETVEHAGRHPREIKRRGPGQRRSSNRPKHASKTVRYRGRMSFRLNGKPVPTTACSTGRPETLACTSRPPVRTRAPSPRAPRNVCPRNGAWTTPTVGLPYSTSATETPTTGNLCR